VRTPRVKVAEVYEISMEDSQTLELELSGELSAKDRWLAAHVRDCSNDAIHVLLHDHDLPMTPKVLCLMVEFLCDADWSATPVFLTQAALAAGRVSGLRVYHASSTQLAELLDCASIGAQACSSDQNRSRQVATLNTLDVGDVHGEGSAALARLLASPCCALQSLAVQRLGPGSDVGALVSGLSACTSDLQSLTVHGLASPDVLELAAGLSAWKPQSPGLRHLCLPDVG
jgi:hypothetical protein